MDVAYQVFIERPAATGPDAVGQLARAMAARYGMREVDLRARLEGGRLRVKGTADLATAEQFKADLEALGAICSIVDGQGRPIGGAAAAAALPPPVRPSTPVPPPVRPSALGAAALPPRPSAEIAVARTSSGNFQSGLSAAFSIESGAPTDLGALSRSDEAFSLSSLDGSDTALPAAPPEASFGPPGGGDRFAPPEAHEAALTLEVAAPPPRASQPAVAPPPVVAPAPAVSVARAPTGPVAMVAASPGPLARVREFLRHAPTRFVVGVALSVLLGFLPAHVVGRLREGPAFAALDAEVKSRQSQVITSDDYGRLDAMRATWLARKEEKQRDLAITSILLWGLLGGGLAFVWFRKLDWERLLAAPARP